MNKNTNCINSDKKVIRVNLEVTRKCILNCRMCHAWKNSVDAEELTIEEWRGFINSLDGKFDADISISFGGGEALLKDGILDIVNLCSKKKYETVIPTNAFIIDREMAQKIVDSGLNMLYISLDSCNEETHDYLRGTKGTYYNAMRAIDYIAEFRKNAPRIQIGTVISDKNLDDLVRLAHWACTDKRLFGITFQAITTPFYTPEDAMWYTKDEYRDLWPKDINKVRKVIRQIIKLKEKGYKIWNPVSQLEVFIDYYENPERFIKKGACHLGYNYFGIGSHGDVFLCFMSEPINNIREYDFDEIWNSERAQQARQNIKQCERNCQILINCWFDDNRPHIKGGMGLWRIIQRKILGFAI